MHPKDQAAGPPKDGGRPGTTATAGEETAAPESFGLEQCPNCAILLTWDERGPRCVVCGFPYDKKRPSRPAELDEYLARVRRGDRRADAKELIDLAERFGLQWGRPELKLAPRRLLTRDDSGPALAVQEASGSERYLVVVLGEAPWLSGLVHFFSIEEEGGATPVTRVRLLHEAIAELDGGGNLECQSAGKLQVVARVAAAERAAAPAKPPAVAAPAQESATKQKSTPAPPTPSIAPPGGPTQPANGKEIWPTPNSDGQKDDKKAKIEKIIRVFLPLLTEILAFLLILGIVGAYLFWPWIEEIQMTRSLEPSDEDYSIDCFILRDASTSPRPEAYDRAEQQILDFLNVSYGDRISYAFFGTDVLPKPIPAPSSDNASIEAMRQAAGKNKQIYATTDFSHLFNELKATIKKDRETQAATRRKAHVDVVVILSDGVPDLSPGKMSYPGPGQEFIPGDVITAFRDLVTGKYATQERIYVRLVLIGGELQRISDIRGEWERALDPKVFEVISYSEVDRGNLGDKLLKPFKGHSHIALKLHPLEDDQRRLLDQGKRFRVAYSARSVGEGGELRILSGTLVDDQQREMELNAFRNDTIKTTNPKHFRVISVPSPNNGEALGETIRSDGDFIYLEPDASEKSADFLSEQSTYSLKLKVVVESHPNSQRLAPIVDPDPPTLRVGPCNLAEKRRLGRARLGQLSVISIALGCIFLIGSLAWHTTKRSSGKTWLSRLNDILERTVVLPYKRWFEALIILFLILMTFGIVFLEQPLLVVICVVSIIASVFFLLGPFRESQTAHMWARLVEFIVLPFIIHGAAHYIFK